MKFRISRTSERAGEYELPCAGARFVKIGEFGYYVYEIDIDDLDQMMALVKKEGQIIISPDDFDDDHIPMIEIYDTYRE